MTTLNKKLMMIKIRQTCNSVLGITGFLTICMFAGLLCFICIASAIETTGNYLVSSIVSDK